MIPAPLPPEEASRLFALDSLRVLDTAADPVLNGLVRSAATALDCRVSLVSLIDAERQWFKAKFGIDASETPRAISFCSHAILAGQHFEVPDASADPRFADNPLVTGAPNIRFYAGVPLDVDGHKIGTLCVVDSRPRRLDAGQRALLADLARAVEHWMVSWRQRNQLAEAEAYRRNLFEQLGDGVLLLDVERRVVDANPQAVSLFGLSREQLLGMLFCDLMPDSERERFGREAPAIVRGDSPLTEWEQVRPDDSRFATEISARPLEDGHCLVVVRDVSARRAQEQQLRRFSMAVEQSSESIIITDRHGTIEYVNLAAIRTSGYTAEELIGHHANVLRSGPTASEGERQMQADLGRKQPWKGLLHSRRKDGSEYIEFAVITPLTDAQGKTVQYLAVMEDVTEKTRMGEELDRHRHHLEELVAQRTAELALAKADAEAANEAKSAFLATMSHEIRTPMNGVVGTVDVLRQSSLTPYQSELADTIRESALALLGIIDDILDFSKIEAGRVAIEPEPVELRRLVEGVCYGLQPLAAAAAVAVQTFVDPRLPDWIISDTVRLRQILNNLLGNAIKFTDGVGRPGCVRVRAELADAGGLRMVVSDNGIGMPPATQARIFQPFEQGEGSIRRRYGGTGLGLAISRRLIELLSGTIEVQSAVGEGTTFTVNLPLQVDESKPLPAPAADLSGLRCHLVLRDAQQARDWSAYLGRAGALPQSWGSVPALAVALDASRTREQVAIVETDSNDLDSPPIPEGFGSVLVQTVRIDHGQRRSPRLIRPGLVSMDGDAIHRDALLRAVAMAAGRAHPALHEASGSLPIDGAAPPTADEAAAQGRLILVAEDNEINRKVIRRQLALLGLAADLAADGLEALDRWRSRRYSLLLTDLHMPGLDGYELAATIRREESAGERIPILALTANALRDEAARCHSLGMDGYLTKPIQLQHLGTALSIWLGPVLPAGSQASSTAPAPVEPPLLDDAAAEAMIGSDPELLLALRRDFLVSALAAASDLRAAIAVADWRTATSIAHRLKSSARTVGAATLGSCCEALEKAGNAGESATVGTAMLSFESLLAGIARRIDAAPVADAAVAVRVDGNNDEAGVLVLDDDPFQLQVVQRQLKSLGVATVHACRSGPLVLAWLKERDTSALLLIVDLDMPEMDGVEFMRHLSELHYAGTLALLSGAGCRMLEAAAKLASAHQLNVLGYFPKPVSSQALRALLDRWHGFQPPTVRGAGKAYSGEDIRLGIAAGEIHLHYQPKVSLADGELVGVEALVRWLHPVDGLVYPDAFVAAAEAHGQIDALSRSVISQALAQTRQWRDSGLNLRICVNISMDNLARLDFADFVLEEIARHAIAPGQLVLEVTESRLMGDMRVPMDILTRLRLRRVGLAIDDFGTGHSSLAQIRDIPFDELKIDRSFVHGAETNITQRAIFKASLDLAHQLDMIAVAEGAEDRSDWDFAQKAGCDIVQGYFIARPMQGQAVAIWAVQWRRRFATEFQAVRT